jgi:hypothetical protein
MDLGDAIHDPGQSTKYTEAGVMPMKEELTREIEAPLK